jgi:DNA-binding MarR family transcriptional regulator
MRTDPDLGVLLGTAYAAFVEMLRAELAEAGHPSLHRSFGYVARALAERPLNLRELAEHLGITSQGAIKIVDELEADGLLARIADPADGRAKKLELTRRGRTALAAARDTHAKLEKRLAAEVGARHVASLRRALSALIDCAERDGVRVRLRPV